MAPPLAFVTAFGLALLQAMIALEKQPGNATLVSPLSASAALTLALNGAGLPSKTQAELLRALTQNSTVVGTGADQEALVNKELMKLMAMVPSASSKKLESKEQSILANALWTRRGVAVNKGYADSMNKMFKASVKVADSASDINAWVKNVTQGLIPQLLGDDMAFDVVLTNALYFKGKWKTPFEERNTSPRQFTTHKGTKHEVSMMRHEFYQGEVLTAAAPAKFKAVRMPYRSGNFSAILVLPDNATTKPESLLPLLAGSGKTSGGSAAGSLFVPLPGGSGRYKGGSGGGAWKPSGGLVVSLPRFKLRASMSLGAPLQKLGVKAAFSSAANFSRAEADPGAPLQVSDVIQEVVLNVDEEGTEAAAATAVVMLTSGNFVLEPPPEIVFDRPFIFALVHDASGAPLVLGVVRDPPAPTNKRPPAPRNPWDSMNPRGGGGGGASGGGAELPGVSTPQSDPGAAGGIGGGPVESAGAVSIDLAPPGRP